MKKIKPVIILTSFLLYGLWLGLPVRAVEMTFTGILTEKQPCTLLAADKDIVVELGTVTDKYLYLNGRTPGKLFSLHLMDCDTSLSSAIKMTFSGNESIQEPGFLMPDAGGQASGIVIGMEAANGTMLALNQQSNAQQIVSGNNVITLRAYIKGEAGAITNRTISQGTFTAAATFGLEYE